MCHGASPAIRDRPLCNSSFCPPRLNGSRNLRCARVSSAGAFAMAQAHPARVVRRRPSALHVIRRAPGSPALAIVGEEPLDFRQERRVCPPARNRRAIDRLSRLPHACRRDDPAARESSVRDGPGRQAAEFAQLFAHLVAVLDHVFIGHGMNWQVEASLPVLHEAIVTGTAGGDIVQIVGKGAGSIGEVLAPDRQRRVAPVADAMDDARAEIAAQQGRDGESSSDCCRRTSARRPNTG